MSDHYQYVDTYYMSSYPDGESVNSGATRLNYGYPSQACYGFPGQATASGSSASVFVGPNQLPANVGSPTVNEDSEEQQVEELRYTVKVINAGNSSGYVIKKWDINARFSSVSDLKDQLASDFTTLLQDGADFLFGYIQRGHGMRGKQFSITEDNDIRSMYDEYQGRREIIMWMKICKRFHSNSKSTTDVGSRKRQSSVDNAEGSSSKRLKSGESEQRRAGSKYQGHLSKMNEVDEIIQDLENRHGESKVYSTEQIRVWAHMIQMKQHTSYDDPPDKPFFRHSKRLKDKSSRSEGTMSPAKRINLRTECINQLDKWHMLLEKGAITSEQYQQLQDTILGDIKKF